MERLNRDYDKPFFLGVGLLRVHVPLYVPQKWFDLYSLESITISPYRADDLSDVPPVALRINDLPMMPTTEWARASFTASLLTFQGGITVPGYAASKGVIGQLTMALSNEWASKGVQVNAIAPGYIATDNTQVLKDNPERSASIIGCISAGRRGQPEDFKGPTVLLASSAAGYVSVVVLLVDGGWMGVVFHSHPIVL